MVTKDEALKMAIEGLLELHSFVNEELETAYRCNTNQAVKLNAKLDGVEKSIQACKEALEQPSIQIPMGLSREEKREFIISHAPQPAQEPYKFIHPYYGNLTEMLPTKKEPIAPSWQTNKEFVLLSDDEIEEVLMNYEGWGRIDFARAIEQALKEKNT